MAAARQLLAMPHTNPVAIEDANWVRTGEPPARNHVPKTYTAQQPPRSLPSPAGASVEQGLSTAMHHLPVRPALCWR